MRFETFGYYRQKEKSRKKSVFVNSIFPDLFGMFPAFMSESGTDCDVYKVCRNEDKDKQKFVVVLCCANRKDTDRVGRDIAFDHGIKVMRKYLEEEEFYDDEIFRGLIYQWRNDITQEYGLFCSSEEKQRFYRDYAPSFMAIAGGRDEVLFVQCGQGHFIIEMDDRVRELYLDSTNEACYQFNGFSEKGAPLYFRKSSSVPKIVMMVSPYKLDNMKVLFRDFSSGVSEGLMEQKGLRYCLRPFITEIKEMEERRNVRTAIAGYVQYAPVRNPESGSSFGSQYTSYILKKQEKKQKEQRLQKLNDVKQNRYTLEVELAQLKQQQIDMRKQQQNLEEEREKTIKWVQAQKKYLASKEELNHYPND